MNGRAPTPRRWHEAARLAVLAAALLDLGARVDGVVDGDHCFRQAHVLANVELLLDGAGLAPGTYNGDLFLRLYDLPVWQLLLAVVARASGWPVAVVAEAGSVAAFALLYAAVWAALAAMRVSALAGTVALAVLALAPIGRFWFAAASIDPFVAAMAATSFAGWLWWRAPQATAGGRRFGGLVWLLCGALATGVKCPAYLPTAATVLAIELRANGVRGLLRPWPLAWLLTQLAAFASFRWATAVANADSVGWPDRATELAWYFGSLQERSSFAPHWRVLVRLAKEVVSLPIAGAAVVGLWLGARTWRAHAGARVAIGAAASAVATSLLFLHVNVVHNYYQLPALAPLAVVAGIGVAALLEHARVRACGAWLPVAMACALLGGGVWSSAQYLARIAAPSTAPLRAAGAFVAGATTAGDFVLYATAHGDDNPAFLYFAHRRGANFGADAPIERTLARWRPLARARGTVLTMFVPAALHEFAARCERLDGWTVRARADAGVLLDVAP